MKRNLNLMIKPSSSKCNLKCKYCFYNSIADSRMVKDYGFMKEEILNEIIAKADDYCNGGVCTIGFQGGEALLVGIDFYRKLIECTTRVKNGTVFNYLIQTNGTLLTDEWAGFFKKNNFLIGVSLDGTKDIHNVNRVDYSNGESYNKVIKGINLLKKYKVEFNILVVVTSSLCKKIESCYKFFKKNDLKYLQFIPCLEPLENSEMEMQPYSISPRLYSDFLKKLFDLWYEDVINNDYVSIRYFDNILGLFLGQNYEACDMRGVCSCQHIIESDGTVYPCDFYTYEKYNIGNIIEESFDDIHKKEFTMKFIEESLEVSNKCKNCKYRNICRGGCKRHRENQKDKLNFLCEAYYEFFSYSFDRFESISRRLI